MRRLSRQSEVLALVAGAALGLSIGIARVATMPTVYRSEVVTGYVSHPMSGQLAAEAAGVWPDPGMSREEVTAFLKSHALALSFIEKYDLASVLQYETESSRVSSGLPWTSQRAAEQFLRQVLIVIDDVESGLIILQFDWPDSVTAAAWARDYVKEANDFLRRRAVERIEKALLSLQEQLRASHEQPIRNFLYGQIAVQTSRLVSASADGYPLRLIDEPAIAREPHRPSGITVLVASLAMGSIAVAGMLILLRRRSVTSFS